MTTDISSNKKTNLRKWVLWFVLIDFSIFSAWVLWEVGYMGIWAAGFESSGSIQILFDLVIACLIICTWVVSDAKSRGVNPTPWIIATLCTGTIALLCYLLVREYQLDQASDRMQVSDSTSLKSA